jgi:cell shape-determining protein MreD
VTDSKLLALGVGVGTCLARYSQYVLAAALHQPLPTWSVFLVTTLAVGVIASWLASHPLAPVLATVRTVRS